jgi:acetyltransferase EpsM
MYIFGASGHGKVVACMAKALKEKVLCFVDDNPKAKIIHGIDVLATADFNNKGFPMIIGIGNNAIRKQIAAKFSNEFKTLVHLSAIVCETVKLGQGTVVMPGAIINTDAIIGNHCIVNTAAVVEHDCILEDFVHLSPNVALAGGVNVGEGAHIGTSATVLPGVHIGKWAIVGAGAVVIKDVPNGAVVAGNPAKSIKKD